MAVFRYLIEPVRSLLDVGCNVGAWLQHCRSRYPSARLAGVEINQESLSEAVKNVPSCELHHSGAEALPFPDGVFQHVSCLEVLEHLPPDLRPTAFREMHRVLEPGGRLILTVPHAGWFAWLDANNVRLRLPGLYRRVVGEGRRDVNYREAGRQIEWHYHFTLEELLALSGEGWRTVTVRYQGLILFPMMDWLSWPFYRARLGHHPIRRFFERVAGWDYSISYGRASYGIVLVLEKLG